MSGIFGYFSTGDPVQRALAGLRRDVEGLKKRATSSASVGFGPWTALTLLNSWTNVGAPYFDLEYRASVGLAKIELHGRVTGGASGSVVAVIPVDDRVVTADEGNILQVNVAGAYNVGRWEYDASTGELRLYTSL